MRLKETTEYLNRISLFWNIHFNSVTQGSRILLHPLIMLYEQLLLNKLVTYIEYQGHLQ